eukprot:gene8843-11934_t
MHPEVLAAIVMIAPSLVSLFWVLYPNTNPNGIFIGALGCVMHFPWSCMLHLYRAYGKNDKTRTIIFKFDVTFIHIHSIFQSYAWDMELPLFNLIFHSLSIIYIWYCDPLGKPVSKRYIDIMTALGIVLTSFPMTKRSVTCYAIAVAIWAVAFIIYAKKLFKDYSSAIFHILLAGPQFFLLYTLNMPTIQ